MKLLIPWTKNLPSCCTINGDPDSPEDGQNSSKFSWRKDSSISLLSTVTSLCDRAIRGAPLPPLRGALLPPLPGAPLNMPMKAMKKTSIMSFRTCRATARAAADAHLEKIRSLERIVNHLESVTVLTSSALA